MGSGKVVQMQPVESQVKPLKIPMRPKLVQPSTAQEADQRGVPGAKLRINQPAGQEHKSEIRSILRKSSSHPREEPPFEEALEDPMMAKEQKRLSIENLPSVKSKIESYLQNAASEDQQPQPQTPPTPTPTNKKQPKSILMKTGSLDRKKAPKLLHSHEQLSIYAQSATDYSATEDEEHERSGYMDRLPVPAAEEAFAGGQLRKSKSFAGQFECDLDETEIGEKQKTMLSFFNGGQTQPRLRDPRLNQLSADDPRRNSLTSISDEILGDDDLRDVDAMFESLLNNTFEEKKNRGNNNTRGGVVGTVPDSGMRSNASAISSSSRASRGAGAVGEMSANSSSHSVARLEQRRLGEEALFEQPKASGKGRFLPRQQTWAGPGQTPPPAANAQQQQVHQSPSPTQSEYDTACDPWEDY